MELELGTANFGVPYGITNEGEPLTNFEIDSILQYCIDKSIKSIDTAIGYKDSHKRLMESNVSMKDFKITTKFSLTEIGNPNKLLAKLISEISNFGIAKFERILIHDDIRNESLSFKKINLVLDEILKQGLANQVGISCYSEDSLVIAALNLPAVNCFQIPYNICTRNQFNESNLKQLSDNGYSFTLRSIFMQGVLLSKDVRLFTKLDLMNEMRAFLNSCAELNKTPLEACISFAYQTEWAKSIVVGVNSLNQLKKIHSISKSEKIMIENFPLFDVAKSDPRSWN